MVQRGTCGICYGRNYKEHLFLRYANKNCFSGKKITNTMSLENKHLFIPALKLSPPIIDLNNIDLLQNECAYINIIIIRQN